MTPPLWTAAEAARAAGVALPAGAAWVAEGVSIDSRRVAPGDLFVALHGPRFDGHDFVAAALGAGAAAAIVDRPVAGVDPARLLQVADTAAGLDALALAARARNRGRVLAVTGSVGKTSTKEALARVLTAQGTTHASAGNLNNRIGTPLSLARLPESAEFAVFELGMNHAGEIRELSCLVRPEIAVITNVEAVHLEYFESVEGIADAKAEIFDGMGPDGVAILNRDNPHFDRLARRARARGLARIWGFGGAAGADARLVSAALGPDGSEVEADILGRRVAFSLPLPGRHQVQNALAVVLAAAAAGADPAAAAASLAALPAVAGRGSVGEVALSAGSFRVIDESYNASPASVRAALAVIALMQPGAGGRRIAVLGDMLELGSDAVALHAGLADSLIRSRVDLVFTAGPLMHHLHAALPATLRGAHAADSATLAPLVAGAAGPGDVVLVKGSAGSRTGLVVQALHALGRTAERPHAV